MTIFTDETICTEKECLFHKYRLHSKKMCHLAKSKAKRCLREVQQVAYLNNELEQVA